MTASQFAIGIAALTGLAIASPLLGLANGFGGIISIAIIFFGLQRAWMMTARDGRLLIGPFERREPEPIGS